MCEKVQPLQYCGGHDTIQYCTSVTCVFCVRNTLLVELNDCKLKTGTKWGCITTGVIV